MSMWDISIDPPEVKMNFELLCEFHPEKSTRMKPSGCKKHSFTLPDSDKKSHALDMAFNCPYCFAFRIFGIALSKEEHDALPGESTEHDSIEENVLCIGAKFEDVMMALDK